MVYEIASNKKRKQFHIPSLHLNEIALDSVSHLKKKLHINLNERNRPFLFDVITQKIVQNPFW